MSLFEHHKGETPIEDASGLLVKGTTLRSELSVVEGQNVFKAVLKYLTSVPPTNNAAERALRHAVQWRKASDGTRGEWGGGSSRRR